MRTSTRHDHSDISTDQVGCQFGQTLCMIVSPPVYDGQIVPFHKSDLFQTMKSAHSFSDTTVRPGIEKTSRRHCLLRASVLGAGDSQT
jgi:hypothetical protein